MRNRVLLAIDDSPASEAAIDYLAGWLQGTEVNVDLVHALPQAVAPQTVPATTERPTRAQRWLALSREEAQPILIRAVERLKRDGLDPGSIADGFLYVPPDLSAADGLLTLARENGCSTIVVGRNALPWHRELFHHHLADELVKKADGFTIWVVEETPDAPASNRPG